MGLLVEFEEGCFLRTCCNAISRGLDHSPLKELVCTVNLKVTPHTFTVTHIKLDETSIDNEEEVAKLFLDKLDDVIVKFSGFLKSYPEIHFKLVNTNKSEIAFVVKERYFTTKRAYTLKHRTCLNYIPFARFK